MTKVQVNDTSPRGENAYSGGRKDAPLTERQEEILAFLRQEIARNQRPPTLAEMCIRFGWASQTAADDHLRALARKGRVKLDPAVARGIRLVTDESPADRDFIERYRAMPPAARKAVRTAVQEVSA